MNNPYRIKILLLTLCQALTQTLSSEVTIPNTEQAKSIHDMIYMANKEYVKGMSSHKYSMDANTRVDNCWYISAPIDINGFCEKNDIIYAIEFVLSDINRLATEDRFKSVGQNAIVWVNPKSKVSKFMVAPWYNDNIPDKDLILWNQDRDENEGLKEQAEPIDDKAWSPEEIKNLDECTKTALKQYSKEMEKHNKDGPSVIPTTARWLIKAPFEVNKFCKAGDSLVCVSLDFWMLSRSSIEEARKLTAAAMVWVNPDTQECVFVAAPWLNEALPEVEILEWNREKRPEGKNDGKTKEEK